MTMWLAFGGLGIIALGGGLAAAGRRAPWGERAFTWCVWLGGFATAMGAVRVLASGETAEWRIAVDLPGGDWVIGLDPLSSIFLLAILAVGAVAAPYGVAYLARERERLGVWFSHATLAALIIALALVVMARAVAPFLVAWELMAITSYLAIVTEHDRKEVRGAGMLYLVVTHAGTLALFVMFAIWGRGGNDWTFTALAAAAPQLPRGTGLIFALATFGFGLKAGAVPFHFWLPPAHAASPSHVSAMMSGVVIKMGIYGLLRVVVLAGGAPAWWGWTILAMGGVSAVLGVLWALAQHDIKRLLAYHSVENIGIIMLGIATGSLCTTYGHPALAVLGYAAAAMHTVNHALFKSVLFLGAGAVSHATGTRNIEELGGVARQMPLLALTFVVGAAAIIGVPPLNGFVSEWLVFRGLLGTGIAGGSVRLAVLAVPLLGIFGRLTGVQTYRGATLLHTVARDPVLEGALAPLWRKGRDSALRLRAIQHGRLRLYLLYVVVTLLLVLGYVVLWPVGAHP